MRTQCFSGGQSSLHVVHEATTTAHEAQRRSVKVTSIWLSCDSIVTLGRHIYFHLKKSPVGHFAPDECDCDGEIKFCHRRCPRCGAGLHLASKVFIWRKLAVGWLVLVWAFGRSGGTMSPQYWLKAQNHKWSMMHCIFIFHWPVTRVLYWWQCTRITKNNNKARPGDICSAASSQG